MHLEPVQAPEAGESPQALAETIIHMMPYENFRIYSAYKFGTGNCGMPKPQGEM